MFDIGFWELSLIMLLALLVLGPERLPRMVSTLGGWAGRARFMARSLRMQVERELAKEVAESRQTAAPKPGASKAPVQQAAQAAQEAEEEAMAAARAKRDAAQTPAKSVADERSRPD